MAVLTVQEITRAGLATSLTALATGGDGFANDGRTYFHIKNSNASARTLTVVTQKTVDGKAVADDAINVPGTTGDVKVGPFPPDIYNDANGRVQMTYSSEVGLTGNPFRLP